MADSLDPWDVTPDPFASEEEDAVVDPDEVLAQAIHRGRHAGGSHLYGGWRGYYHGLRAGNVLLRAEAEQALAAERLHAVCADAVAAIRAGKVDAARGALARATAIVGL